MVSGTDSGTSFRMLASLLVTGSALLALASKDLLLILAVLPAAAGVLLLACSARGGKAAAALPRGHAPAHTARRTDRVAA